MNRRNFIKMALATSALYSANGLPLLAGSANAAGFASLNRKVLVNVILTGGPDLRFLLPPAFDPDSTSYGYKYWEAKAGVHAIADSASAYQTRWNDDYFSISEGNVNFGILKKCGWLKRMWDAGNVAVISNAIGARTRNHEHSQLVLDQGNLTSGPNDANRSGWGGRLAVEAGGNVLALTSSPRAFCYGPDINDPEGRDSSNLIAAANTRQFGLFKAPLGERRGSARPVATQSLASYYAALKTGSQPDPVYERFLSMEQDFRDFGDQINEHLDTLPLPDRIESIANGGLGINDRYIGRQIRNLYDSLATSDILSLRAASLEYGGWDSHKNQRDLVEPKYEDLFGNDKAFDLLYQEIPADVQDNLVLVFAGEFGRQLRANGANGCDHGGGNSVLIVGNQVNGGIYGDMFPESELDRLDEDGADIEGLTEFDRILGQVADFIVPGSGDIVFPRRSIADIEPGIGLDRLFG